MSLPAYPEYKDTEVPSLRTVPNHWVLKPVNAVASINDDVLPDDTNLDYEINYVDIGCVSLESGIQNSFTILFGDAPSRARRLVRKGDVIVSTVRTYLKAIAPILETSENLVVSTGFAVIRPKVGLEPKFARYSLQSPAFINDVISRSTGVSYPAINASDIGKIVLPFPSKNEQSAIAAFLDRETGKIDALIAEQEKLLDLLAEKRQATISHAVTRGLNPNAPMKDSGIAWLGEVPAHWDHNRKLSYLSQSQKNSFVNGPFGSDLLASELILSGNPVVYIRDITENGYRRVSEWCISPPKAEQLSFCSVIPGDLIMAKVGDPPGLAAVYPEGEPHGIVTQDVIRLRVDPIKAHACFVKWLLNSQYGRNLTKTISVESTRTRVSLGNYKNIKLFIPPLAEQKYIAKFIEREVTKTDILNTNVKSAISLLKERRSALIAAAVTGKIDVRGAMAEDQTA